MIKILLVEDEIHVVSFIKKGLSENGYEVTVALDGKTGLDLALKGGFELVILDIMLPEINGIEVCRKIREKDIRIPIIMLTALGTSENIVIGLESGADDYLVKPFKFIELIARIKSILRRSEKSVKIEENPINKHDLYHFEDIEINDTQKIVYKNKKEISLTRTEYRLLLFLMKHKGRVLSRGEILEDVWGVNFDLGTNVVDVYVNYLRKKIDDDEKKLIQTVVGMGYVLKKVNI